MQELADIATQAPSAITRNFAVIAKGDEVLDWREMLARHQTGQARILEGSNHTLSDFDNLVPEFLEFLHLA